MSPVITRIAIERFRGIEKGEVTGLLPLTVLVGSNGSGKSTVLDALLIGASHSPGDAIGRAVQRREELARGARWLFWRAGGEAVLETTDDHGLVRKSTLTIGRTVSAELTGRLHDAPGPYAQIDCQIRIGPPHALVSRTAFGTNNAYAFTVGPRPLAPARPKKGRPLPLRSSARAKQRETEAMEALRNSPEIRFVEPRPGAKHTSFHNLYTQVVQEGKYDDALAVAKAIVRDLSRIEILTPDDMPMVHLVFSDYAIPLAAAGDGIKCLLRLAFELATRKGGLVLIEEPEVHQHPGAIRQSAEAIVATVRRGVQVVLSTHSLELIDAILASSDPDDLERLCVMRLKLDRGALQSTRTGGSDVAFERSQIDQDLR
jgi:energy-coupling factor transporter ATP-binding protein EcfA2